MNAYLLCTLMLFFDTALLGCDRLGRCGPGLPVYQGQDAPALLAPVDRRMAWRWCGLRSEEVWAPSFLLRPCGFLARV